jgi:deoxyribonuclease-4
MRFGAHVSAAGGLENAPRNAHNLGCDTFQFFSRSPRGGTPTNIDAEMIELFRKYCVEYNLQTCYIHTPYYINFASPNHRIYNGSIEVVRQELERGDVLGVTATMTHLGSAKDIENNKIIPIVATALIKTLQGYEGKNRFLIEIAAGSGAIIGSSFEQVAAIIQAVEKKIKNYTIGVCFDTAHAFASGYDLRNEQVVNDTLKKFDKIIGLERLVVIHANDSLVDFATRKDRHQNIGKGKIGLSGFRALVQHPKLKHLDYILETPWTNEQTIKKDLHTLRSLQTKK